MSEVGLPCNKTKLVVVVAHYLSVGQSIAVLADSNKKLSLELLLSYQIKSNQNKSLS